MSALFVTWICPRSMKVGTGMTTANSVGSPWKSFAIVMTVFVVMAHEHDLGRHVEKLGVGLGDVEAAKGAHRRARPAHCENE